MKKEAQRIAIAEACGWKKHTDTQEPSWNNPNRSETTWYMEDELPDYLNDLNAMAIAEKVLDSAPGRFDEWCRYWEQLETMTCRTFDKEISDDCKSMLSPTAAQRAEAFLKAIGKWKD